MIPILVVLACIVSMVSGGVYGYQRPSSNGKKLLIVGFSLTISGMYIARILKYVVQTPLTIALAVLVVSGLIGCFCLGCGMISLFRMRRISSVGLNNSLFEEKSEVREQEISNKYLPEISSIEHHKIRYFYAFGKRYLTRTTSILWFLLLCICLPADYSLFLISIQPVKKIDEMAQETATLVKCKISRKGWDKIILKNDKGELITYFSSFGKETAEKLKQIVGQKVTVYYQIELSVILLPLLSAQEVSFNNNFFLGYDYTKSVRLNSHFKKWFLCCLSISLFSIYRIWWVNRFPINRKPSQGVSNVKIK